MCASVNSAFSELETIPTNKSCIFIKLASIWGWLCCTVLWHGSSVLETHSFRDPEQKQNKCCSSATGLAGKHHHKQTPHGIQMET